MSKRITRRDALKTAAVTAAAAGSQVVSAPYILAQSNPNSKLNIAGIGVDGRGNAHVKSSLNQNLVAVCDAAEDRLNNCMKRVEGAYRENDQKKAMPKPFTDYRAMLDEMNDQIDAVFVATPDHHHAPASMMAMDLGKHVYCEKPLTHNIAEARQMMLKAREKNVATQMGNQGKADEGWRIMAEIIWSAAIGDVQEVHSWTDRPGIPRRPWWPQGSSRPAGSDPVPDGLHWDIWLGPAPERPYLSTWKSGRHAGRRVYHPFVWRGWWDFGTGALGDIGCHSMSGIFSALKIEHASAVELIKDAGDGTDEMPPTASAIRWTIPPRGEMPECHLYWYDGGYYPDPSVGELKDGQKYGGGGQIVVGSKAKLRGSRLLPESLMKDFQKPDQVVPRCESNHFDEWVTACQGGRPAFSNFDHAGPLTEMVLLGNLAIHAGVGKEVLWDGPNMKCTNRPELNQYVEREYRDGWA